MVFRVAVNCAGAAARTVLALILICLRGGSKFCYKLFPVSKADTEFLTT